MHYARLHPETDPRKPTCRRCIVKHAGGNARYTRQDDVDFISTWYEVTKEEAGELRLQEVNGVHLFEVTDEQGLAAMVAARAKKAAAKRRARTTGRPLKRRSLPAAEVEEPAEEPAEEPVFNDTDDTEPDTEVRDATPAAPTKARRSRTRGKNK